MGENIKRVVAKHISGHDEAILDYMCSIVADSSNDHDALCDALSPLLLDTGSAKNDADVAAICSKIIKELADPGRASNGDDQKLVKLSKPINLATAAQNTSVQLDDIIPKQLPKPTLVVQKDLGMLGLIHK